MSYVNAVASMVVGLLYVPLLLAGIGQGEYGLYQLIGSLIGYMTIMSTVLSAGTTRFYCVAFADGDAERMERVLATCRLIYRFATCVVIIAGATFAWAFSVVYSASLSAWELAEGGAMIGILALNMIVTMNNTISVAVINANERFVFLKATQLAQTLLQPLFIVLLINLWPYATTIVAVQLLLNVALALAQRVYSRRILGARVEMHGLDKALLRSIFVYIGGIIVASVADQLFWKTNQLVLGFFYGSSVVAVYGVACQIYQSYLSLGNVVASVFMPRVSQLHARGDMDGISSLYSRVGRLSLYVLFLIFGGFCTIGREFVCLWAGPEYSDAYVIAIVIMIAFTLDSAQSLGITILQVLDLYRFRAWMYLALAVANFAIVIVVAPLFGGVGCAVVSCTLMLVGNGAIMNVFYQRRVGLDMVGWWVQALRVVVPLVAYICAACLVWHLVGLSATWGSLAAGGFAFLFGYLAVAWFLCMNEYEKSLVASAARRLARRR